MATDTHPLERLRGLVERLETGAKIDALLIMRGTTVAGIRLTRLTDRGLSGSGVFNDEEADRLVRTSFFNADLERWTIRIPGAAEVEGGFQVTSLEYAGMDDRPQFSISLAACGDLSLRALSQEQSK